MQPEKTYIKLYFLNKRGDKMKNFFESTAGIILLIGTGSENLLTTATFIIIFVLFMGLSKIKKEIVNPARLLSLQIFSRWRKNYCVI